MKILQLCKKFPFPLKDGESLAIHNLAKGLVAGGAELHLFCINTLKHFFNPADLPDRFNPYASITAVTLDTGVTLKGAALNLFSRKSFHVARFRSADVAAALRDLLARESFDIIQVEGIHMEVYRDILSQFPHSKVVLRAHNLEYQVWERLVAGTKPGLKRAYMAYLTQKLKRYEVNTLQQTHFLVPISGQDLQNFQRLGFRGRHCLCPIGIDPDQYQPLPKSFVPFSVCFLGSMDWLPNLEGIRWFVEEVWPDFYQRFPDATLHIAGRNMPEALFSLSGKGVHVHGEVPDAVAFLNQYPIMIVPLLSGSGMRAKIIEAMALARVVVTTPMGLEGIPAVDGVSVCLAATREAFVAQLEKLRQQPQLAATIGDGGRSLVLRHFQSAVVANTLLAAYHNWSKADITVETLPDHG